jgi:hypothetical protein
LPDCGAGANAGSEAGGFAASAAAPPARGGATETGEDAGGWRSGSADAAGDGARSFEERSVRRGASLATVRDGAVAEGATADTGGLPALSERRVVGAGALAAG